MEYIIKEGSFDDMFGDGMGGDFRTELVEVESFLCGVMGGESDVVLEEFVETIVGGDSGGRKGEKFGG